MKCKRIIFTFDRQSYRMLKELRDQGGFASLAAAVRESVAVSWLLQREASRGYGRIVARSDGGQDREVVRNPFLR